MLDNYRDLIDELLETPALIRQKVASTSNKPGLAALLTALRQRDRAMLERLHQMTRVTAPNLHATPAIDASLDNATASDEPIAELLATTETARGDLVSLLMNLSLKDWEKTATHDDGGYVTLSEEVERHVEFDEAFRQRLGLPEHR